MLETHDSFSGRRETFEAHGIAPEFFYTTLERERVAFDRADLVVAIKDFRGPGDGQARLGRGR